MMIIDHKTFKEIISILEPFMTTLSEQETFIQQALYRSPFIKTIPLGNASQTFTTQLVTRAIDFGEVEAGKPAVVALLEHAKTKVGIDKTQKIDNVITRVLPDYVPSTGVPSQESPDEPIAGTLVDKTIGEYLLLEKVGFGGFGEVYRAEHIPTGDIVAVKLILETVLSWPGFEKRFNREIQIVQRFDHPYIVKYRDHGHYQDRPYLVIQWVNGGDLRHRLNLAFDGLSVPTVKIICEQMAKALDYVHKNNVIHRDLKPENIMLDGADSYFLTDFGIAKPLGNYTELTESGVALGTLKYAAPEQLDSSNVNHQADIYSFGLIIHELFTGQYPYQDLMHRLTNPLPPLQNILMQDSDELEKVLEQATANNPSDRYRNVVDFYRDFRKALR